MNLWLSNGLQSEVKRLCPADHQLTDDQTNRLCGFVGGETIKGLLAYSPKRDEETIFAPLPLVLRFKLSAIKDQTLVYGCTLMGGPARLEINDSYLLYRVGLVYPAMMVVQDDHCRIVKLPTVPWAPNIEAYCLESEVCGLTEPTFSALLRLMIAQPEPETT